MPSHREKKRYLLVKSSEVKDVKAFRKQINQAVEDFLGALGMARVSLKFIEFGTLSGKNKELWAIICVNRDMLEKVRAAFCIYSGFGENEGEIKVENVSGSLKKLRS